MYRDLNDYELLYMIGEKDNNFDFLYEKYQPLIYKIVREYLYIFKRYGYEIDDLLQIGYLTLYKCSYLYQEESNAKFYTYLSTSIKNALNSEIRVNETKKRQVLNNAFSYDNKLPNSEYTYIDLLSDKKEDHDYEKEKQIFILFKNSLSFFDAGVFEMYYNGYPIKEISIFMEVGRDTIVSSINKIKKYALSHRYLYQ